MREVAVEMIFHALLSRPAFQPETIEVSGSDPDGTVADLPVFRDLFRLPSIKHLHLNVIEAANHLADVALPPSLQTLRIHRLWIHNLDRPWSVARFVEKLRKLPSRPSLGIHEDWMLQFVIEEYGDLKTTRRMYRCMEVEWGKRENQCGCE
ncbi:hypothetical protein DFJ74DRAFT_763264 [Hyaloraphidium curvatum]|nr:hypothetical protein DFJ74DRAFT_763264 [Hyaloraphidium curvatum]